MALLDINLNPSERELRQFAGIWFPAFCGVVGGLLWFRAEAPIPASTFWAVGLVVAVAGLARPQLVRPLFVGWICAAYPIGWVFSHLLLAIIFYGVLTPLGLLQRLFGRDALAVRLDPSADTYWVPHAPDSGKTERYFRQS